MLQVLTASGENRTGASASIEQQVMLTNPGTLLCVLKLQFGFRSLRFVCSTRGFWKCQNSPKCSHSFQFYRSPIFFHFPELQIDFYSGALHEQDNSSRFGKWINVHFDRKGTVAGGCCIPRTFLIDSLI